jgi:F-type H+-transporting ATPase subunit gamma
MASMQEIKRRIRAVTNTSQITKAMEMVSATKMRRSQEIALLSRPYAIEALRMLVYLEKKTPYRPEIMRARDIRHTLVVVIASDKGLAGSFNTNIIRAFEKRIIDETKGSPESFSFVAVGKKAEEFLERKKLNRVASFKNFGDHVEVEETEALFQFVIRGFLWKKWDRVLVVSTHFRTTLRQEVLVREILPVRGDTIWSTVRELVPEAGRFSGFSQMVTAHDPEHGHTDDFEYLIEPDAQSVLEVLAPAIFEILIYDLILEANASEHSARMVAMKNASENAGELKEGLLLQFNKIRQARITQEIAEIVGGAEALQKN